MPMPQLKVRSISGSAIPPVAASHWNTGSTGTFARSMRAPRPFGSTRGMLSGNPPPVMCASALTAGLAHRREARLHIDARRRQHRFAQRMRRGRTGGRVPGKPARLDDLAHQRKAVRMHARRREAEHDVARRDVRARQQLVALGRADRKAGEIVVAGRDRGPAFRRSRRRSARSPPRGSPRRCPSRPRRRSRGSSLPQAK